MVLKTAHDNVEVNQVAVSGLKPVCLTSGVTAEEFACACGELAGMDAFFFYRSQCDSAAIVKFRSLPEYAGDMEP